MHKFLGGDLCYLNLCLWDSISEMTGYMSTCFDNLAGLKAFEAVRTTSPLVYQSQKRWLIRLNDMRSVFLGSPDILQYEIMISAMGSQGVALLWGFFFPSRPWVSQGEIYKEARSLLVNQHGAQWRDLCDSQTVVWDFIPGPILGTWSKFLTFNKFLTF